MTCSNSLAKNSVYSLIYNLVNVLFPLIGLIYVSRILMPLGIGKFEFANTFVSYFVSFACLGLPTYAVSTISRTRSDTVNLNTAFSELLLINFLGTSIALIVYCICIFNLEFIKNDLCLYFSLGVQIVLCYINIEWLFQGEENYRYITRRNVLIKFVSLLCIIIFIKSSDDYIVYAIIMSCTMGANCFCNVFYAKKYVRFSWHNLCLRRHIKPFAYISISLLFSTLYSKVDVTMLGMMSSENAVGIYSTGHKLINGIIIACAAVTSVYLPRMSYLYHENNKEFDRILNIGFRIITFITIPVCFGIILLSEDLILLLYGDAFTKASFVLAIFAVLVPIKGICDLLCYQTVICIGKEKLLVPAAGIALIVNVALNCYLIPSFAEIGATTASVFTEITVNCVMLIFVCRNIAITINKREVLVILLSTLAMCVSVVVVKFLSRDVFINCSLGFVVGAIVYIFINTVAGNELVLYIYNSIVNRFGK